MSVKTVRNGGVEIFGTLFRDGMQGRNMKMSLPDALNVLHMMQGVGFHYAELGFAGSNDFSTKLIRAAVKEDFGQMKLAAFGRTLVADVDAILNLKVPVAVIVCKSRLLDVIVDLGTNRKGNLTMIRETIRRLKEQGREVILDLEHAMDAVCGRREYGKTMSKTQRKRNCEHFFEVVEAGIEVGADCLVVCDTTGGASPEEVAKLFDYLTKKYSDTKFGFHGHNCGGLAVANSRTAVLHGACHVQGVTNGYGERTGNVDLLTLIARLQLKDGIRVVSTKALASYTAFAHRTALALGLSLDDRTPFVGNSACGTWAGMHAAAKRPGLYLSFFPEAVGNSELVGVNRQSGRANIMAMARLLKVPLTRKQATSFMTKYKAIIESGGFEASQYSFILACRRARGEHKAFFWVKRYEVSTGRQREKAFAKAEVQMVVGRDHRHEVSTGDGPVDAMRRALYKALEPFYPTITQIHLEFFHLSAFDVSEDETGAPVMVVAQFASGDKKWETIGVHSNSNDAAFQALIDGIEWFLLQEGKGNKHEAVA